MKKFLRGMQISAVLILLSSFNFQLKAQEEKVIIPLEKQTKIVLDVKQLNTDQDEKKIEEMLISYPGKILSHTIDKRAKKITVFISEYLEVVDLLELFDIIGFSAGYLNENNEYVKLDANGYLSKQPYGFKKQ